MSISEISNKENTCACGGNCSCNSIKFFEDTVVENEKEVNPSDPCDPTSPDYPWVPCGIKENN